MYEFLFSSKGYYRQGIALQCMGRYSEALAAFASALALDNESEQLFDALVGASLKSHMKGRPEKIVDLIFSPNLYGPTFGRLFLPIY